MFIVVNTGFLKLIFKYFFLLHLDLLKLQYYKITLVLQKMDNNNYIHFDTKYFNYLLSRIEEDISYISKNSDFLEFNITTISMNIDEIIKHLQILKKRVFEKSTKKMKSVVDSDTQYLIDSDTQNREKYDNKEITKLLNNNSDDESSNTLLSDSPGCSLNGSPNNSASDSVNRKTKNKIISSFNNFITK